MPILSTLIFGVNSKNNETLLNHFQTLLHWIVINSLRSIGGIALSQKGFFFFSFKKLFYNLYWSLFPKAVQKGTKRFG